MNDTKNEEKMPQPGTPLPWKAEQISSDGQWGITFSYGSDEEGSPLEGIVCRLSWGDNPLTEARDAAYIAAACNAFPAMVELLREFVAECQNPSHKHHRDKYWECQISPENIEGARALLTSLEADQPSDA